MDVLDPALAALCRHPEYGSVWRDKRSGKVVKVLHVTLREHDLTPVVGYEVSAGVAMNCPSCDFARNFERE